MRSTRMCARRTLLALGALLALSSAAARGDEPTPRIVGGSVVPDDRYPFMVAVYEDGDGDGSFGPTCGGSLIAARWVLTAAHCLVDATTQTVNAASAHGVVLGTRSLAQDSGLFLVARRVFVHPDYDPRGNVADIALIELPRAVDGAVISLPSADSAIPEIGEPSIVAGWGLTAENGAPVVDLREVSLPIVSHALCLPFYVDVGGLDSGAHLCAGGARTGGRDSCQGDSGGPLFVPREGVWVQAGIVSSGIGCARPRIPGVYTRLTTYVDWVASLVDGLQLVSGDPAGGGQGDPVDGAQVLSLIPGLPEAQRTGSLLRGEAALYEVSGNSRVDLTTTIGDADLYLVSGVRFRTEDIVCQSVSTTARDSCDVPATGERVFAIVFGYVDSSYTIDVVGGDEPSPLTPVPLGASQTVEGVLREGEVRLYAAQGPVRLTLVSSAGGDADLYAFADTSLSDEALLCRSTETTPTDVCTVSAGGEVYVAVRGFSDVSYRLRTESPAADVDPPTPDPLVPGLAGSGGGGGGGASWACLLVLLGIGVRRQASAATLSSRRGSVQFGRTKWQV